MQNLGVFEKFSEKLEESLRVPFEEILGKLRGSFRF